LIRYSTPEVATRIVASALIFVTWAVVVFAVGEPA
jgi:hypothetical protein